MTIPSAGPYQISKLIRSIFITGMREAFKTDADYTYAELSDKRTDIDNTKIDIIDITPYESAKFPIIVVNTVTDRGGSIYFSDDLLSEIRDDNGKLIGEEHGNQLRLSVNLEVWAFSNIEREEVVDKEYIYLKTLKDKFAEFGIEIRLIELMTPRQESVGTRLHYVSGLLVDTYSEWTMTDTISSDELISKFKVALSQS